MDPVFFATSGEFRAWFAANHETAPELMVGYFKKGTGLPGITWPESVDQALCFGWIDGVRRRFDADTYTQRFTPRRLRSIWSRVNIAHVERLKKEGRMAPSGLAAYEARDERLTGLYSFERERPELTPAHLRTFRANAAAWTFYQGQAPGYRRITAHWVTSAKREETRAKRLGVLIGCSARGRKIPPLEALSAKRPRQGSSPALQVSAGGQAFRPGAPAADWEA